MRQHLQTDFCLSISFFIHWIYSLQCCCEMAICLNSLSVSNRHCLSFRICGIECFSAVEWRGTRGRERERAHKWCDNFCTHNESLFKSNKMEHSILIRTWNCSQSPSPSPFLWLHFWKSNWNNLCPQLSSHISKQCWSWGKKFEYYSNCSINSTFLNPFIAQQMIVENSDLIKWWNDFYGNRPHLRMGERIHHTKKTNGCGNLTDIFLNFLNKSNEETQFCFRFLQCFSGGDFTNAILDLELIEQNPNRSRMYLYHLLTYAF